MAGQRMLPALSPATQAQSLGCFSQRPQNVLAVKPLPGVLGLLASEGLQVSPDVARSRGATWEGSLEEGASFGWRKVEISRGEQRKAREGVLLGYISPEFPSHPHTAGGDQVSDKVVHGNIPDSEENCASQKPLQLSCCAQRCPPGGHSTLLVQCGRHPVVSGLSTPSRAEMSQDPLGVRVAVQVGGGGWSLGAAVL